MIKIILLIYLSLSISLVFAKKQSQTKIQEMEVMYGATIRIRAAAFSYHLHSHRTPYPEGSGQQSVTGMPSDHDYNSLWTLKQANNQPIKTYQQQVKCGDKVRLEHALTRKNLHSSQEFKSMITKGQEISCFGREGQGDENDDWKITCKSKAEGQFLFGGDIFQLIHSKTEKKVKMSKFYEYSYVNWENCPFQGQLEISGSDKSTKETEFKIVGGVFFQDNAKDSNDQKVLNDEL